jgi:hypothetical protein
MDIVYVYKDFSKEKWAFDNWVELKYSLRSISNLSHNKVFIVWDNPNRTKNIIHIPVNDNLDTPYKNVLNKLRIICDSKQISDNFILMNDDFFILKPIKTIPYYSNWTLKQHLNNIHDKNYQRAVLNCLKLFPDGINYNLHTPIIYNKKLLKQTLQLIGDQSISIRSVYWNQHKLKHINFFSVFGRADSKVRHHNIKDIKNIESQSYLSSNDELNYKFKQFLNKTLPNSSNYIK